MALGGFLQQSREQTLDLMQRVQRVANLSRRIQSGSDTGQGVYGALTENSNDYLARMEALTLSHFSDPKATAKKSWIQYRSATSGLLIALSMPKSGMEPTLSSKLNELMQSVRSSSTYPTANKMFHLAQGTTSMRNLVSRFDNYNFLDTQELFKVEENILTHFPVLSQKFYSSLSSGSNPASVDLAGNESRAYQIKEAIDPTKFHSIYYEGPNNFGNITSASGRDRAHLEQGNPTFMNVFAEIIDGRDTYKVLTLGYSGPVYALKSSDFDRLLGSKTQEVPEQVPLERLQPHEIIPIPPANPQAPLEPLTLPEAELVPLPERTPSPLDYPEIVEELIPPDPIVQPDPIAIHRDEEQEDDKLQTSNIIPVIGSHYKVNLKHDTYPSLIQGSVLKYVGNLEWGAGFEDLITGKRYVFSKKSWWSHLTLLPNENLEIAENSYPDIVEDEGHHDEAALPKPLPSPLKPKKVIPLVVPEVQEDVPPLPSESELEFFKESDSGAKIVEEMSGIREAGKSNVNNYTRIMKPLADYIFHHTGLPPKILMAQGIQETLWGTSNVLEKTNNATGISCFDEGAEISVTIPFVDPARVIKAKCSVPRPKKEGGFYYSFDSVYEATLYQVWNLLYNPTKSKRYAKARENAKKILNAKNKAQAIKDYSSGLIQGMAGWATDADYVENLTLIHRMLGKSSTSASASGDVWLDIPLVQSPEEL
ncbi:MAG: glucosaminidase domain-containing protein [Bdellovibrionota bacterium]